MNDFMYSTLEAERGDLEHLGQLDGVQKVYLLSVQAVADRRNIELHLQQYFFHFPYGYN